MQIFKYLKPFRLEKGGLINNLEIAYHTYGDLNKNKNNVVWICHALTADSDVMSWWQGLVGKNKFFDPSEHFIVCANFIGSCYGTTGPLSINPETAKPWYRTFPEITVRDMVNAHELLRKHLGIEHINTLAGGSIGGFQALEWAIMNPDIFSNVVLIACSAKSSPWVIALNESQRMAITADSSFFSDTPEGGSSGLKAARSIALLSYRNRNVYNMSQSEISEDITENFRACSYQQHQGEKLSGRFDAYSYYALTKAVDSHNIARGRGSVHEALKNINARTLVIGISTDILFPVEEQMHLATYIKNAGYSEIISEFGHDAFLIESEQLSEKLSAFLNIQLTNIEINN